MKLILSRKGFDSAAGGCASPLIDGRPVSLPIPTRMPTPTRYRDLAGEIAGLVTDLTKGRITADQPCHLDPDLDPAALRRAPGWRGALGQVSAAQSHLANHRIGTGDLFLFWGLFRPAEESRAGQWHYTGPAEHRIFGWLQVDEILNVGDDPRATLEHHRALDRHPHLHGRWPANNTVYLARDRLALPGSSTSARGYGLLPRGHRLTATTSAQPSLWTIPAWLTPEHGGTGLTYHPESRWLDATTLRAAARGQEFIADIGDRRDALDWIGSLLEDHR